MRVIGAITISAAFLLAGCANSEPSLLSLGDCEQVDEEDGFDLNGTFYDCENVVGAGVFTMSMTCAQGYAGVERDEGNGTVQFSLSASNGTFFSAVVEPQREDFGGFGQNRTTTMRVETAANFTGGLAFGMVCWDWEDWY